MKKEKGYVIFPLILLKGAVENISVSIKNIIDYCYYYNTHFIENEYEDEARDYLEIDLYEFDVSLENGKMLYDSIPEKAVKVSLRKKFLWEYYFNEKSEYEIVLLIAFASLKSIIQRQSYKKITNKYLLSRMSFSNNIIERYEGYLQKYTTRHYLDKIKKDLELHWHLKLYGDNMRGFYVSFELSQKDLIKRALQHSKKYQYKLLKKGKMQSKIEAINELAKNNYINLTE